MHFVKKWQQYSRAQFFVYADRKTINFVYFKPADKIYVLISLKYLKNSAETHNYLNS